MQKTTMKHWSQADKPREKMLEIGAEALSDSELLAILIGSGSREENAVELCRRILAEVDQDLNALGQWGFKQFTAYSGVGAAKAVSIMAALELGRRWRNQSGLQRQKVRNSQEAYEIFARHLAHLRHEEFWALFLSQSNRVLYKMRLGKGGWTGTVADIRLLFKEALHQQATGIILAHNHPSGELKPSTQDQRLTNKAKQAGEIMDIRVLDHLIIGESGYYSFADEGGIS